EDAGVVIDGAGHHRAELGARGHSRDEGEGGIALENVVMLRSVHPDLPEVVHHPDGIEAGLVGGPRNLAQRAAKLGRAAGPGEVTDRESDLHWCTLSVAGRPIDQSEKALPGDEAPHILDDSLSKQFA